MVLGLGCQEPFYWAQASGVSGSVFRSWVKGLGSQGFALETTPA